MNDKNIRIFDIQRFSVHDGPGIRTTVFLKGCNLFCPWCANPESQASGTELMYFEKKCAGCGECARVCPNGAIEMVDGAPVFHRRLCKQCAKCALSCQQYAIELTGRLESVEGIMDVLRRDKVYYQSSGGGITLSGGEPLCQIDAAVALLAAAKQEGLHTAMETAASVREDVFKRVLPLTDLFLFDLKMADPVQLKNVTGGDLDLILNNLALAVEHSHVMLRIPVIPGYNDSPEAIDAILRLAAERGVRQADLLAYHLLGKSKYASLGRGYDCTPSGALTKEQLEPYRSLGAPYGMTVTIGGH